ncbi:MAG: hypothetical protein Q9P01_16625 [Anaerolineae bacterium]|nr:hypothetical protein [Anaerolineae bacterium]MDQ7036390.1 hypothetical protein [Anaerolineae bacterium]
MKKLLFLVCGLLAGVLLAKILQRPKMARLQQLEAKEADRKANNAQYKHEWQQELATMPFEERMDYELFEAGLKRDGWIGDDNEES